MSDNKEEQSFTTQPFPHNNGHINEPGNQGFPGSKAEETAGTLSTVLRICFANFD